MIRNMDKLREKGIFVQGSWLNKKVLMLDETITSTMNPTRVHSPGEKENSDGDSIFNIELSNQALK